MPNPKTNTVTLDVATAVKELKAGRVEYRVEKSGIVHIPVGRKSFSGQQIRENIDAVMDSLIKAKPASAKGHYVQAVAIATTMSPGIKIDTTDFKV
jgi:large subunit ribosomal protein L1